MIVMALQQRIGEIAAQYELDKAIIRAEYTQLAEELKIKEEVANNYSISMQAKCDEELVLQEKIKSLEFEVQSLKTMLGTKTLENTKVTKTKAKKEL